VVTNFINQALSGKPLTVYGDGSQTRSFQFVSDLVEGIVRLMRVDWQEPVNLGNPDEIAIRRFAEIVRDLVNPAAPIVQAPMPADDPRQRRPDIRTAQMLLDWQPRVSLDEGLAETVRYFQPQGIEV
jgi:dTDP-glucose 4,6-dehydratase